MKELKFRIWDIDRRHMDYINDLYRFEEEGIHEVVDGKASAHHAEYIVMQYLGVEDKNGKSIYEGDIISAKYGFEKNHAIDDVGDFIYRLGEYSVDGEDIELIGNIHEHPHLLEGK